MALAALPLIALAALLVAHALSRTGTRGRARLVTASVFAALFAVGRRRPVAAQRAPAERRVLLLRLPALDRLRSRRRLHQRLPAARAERQGLPVAAADRHRPRPFGVDDRSGHRVGAVLRRRASGGAAAAGAGPPRSRPTAPPIPYRQAVCIAGLFYALLGTWFSIRAARQFFPASIAATGAALVVGGSFILWYALAEPIDGARADDGGRRRVRLVLDGDAWAADRSCHWIGLGALAGFAGLVRWQSVLFALLPAIEALAALWRASRDPRRRVRSAPRSSAASPSPCAAVVGVHAADARLEGDLRALPGGVAGRAADHLAPSAPRRRPVRVAERPVRDVADPLRRGASGWSIFARRRPAVGVPSLVVDRAR